MRVSLIVFLVTAWFWHQGVCQQRTCLIELLVDNEQKKVDFLIDGELFTSYLYSDKLKKPVLWPVISASGNTLTRSYPLVLKEGERVDHAHHVGVWLNYGNVNGLDFWNNSQNVPAEKQHQYGTIHHSTIEAVKDGLGKATLKTTSEWRSSDNNLMLKEATSFEVMALTEIRIIDRTTTLTAMIPEVRFADNKEGLFAIRVARALELPMTKPTKLVGAEGKPVEKLSNQSVNGNYHSATGMQGKLVWGTQARWMKLYGRLNGREEAIIIIDHPGNPGYPTYWHARDYGLFSANPLGQKVFSKGEKELNFNLNAGESVTFRYRLILASSSITNRQIDKLADQFAIK